MSTESYITQYWVIFDIIVELGNSGLWTTQSFDDRRDALLQAFAQEYPTAPRGSLFIWYLADRQLWSEVGLDKPPPRTCPLWQRAMPFPGFYTGPQYPHRNAASALPPVQGSLESAGASASPTADQTDEYHNQQSAVIEELLTEIGDKVGCSVAEFHRLRARLLSRYFVEYPKAPKDGQFALYKAEQTFWNHLGFNRHPAQRSAKWQAPMPFLGRYTGQIYQSLDELYAELAALPLF